jgi:hypothetical protein
MEDLVRVVARVRVYGTPFFRTDVIPRRIADGIVYQFPLGPFRVSAAKYVSPRVVATVEVAETWDFTSRMSHDTAFIVIAELDRLGFDVASAWIIPEEA